MTVAHSTVWEQIGDLPHSISYVDVGNWKTRVLSVGDSDDVIVLMAGTTGHIEAYAQNIRALAQNHRVIAYDYPGHGFTNLTDADLEIVDYEKHLIDLLEVLGLEKVHLCGESLGGWIALKFAQSHADRVKTLILSAPGGQVAKKQTIKKVRPVSRAAVEDPTFDNVKQRLQVVIHNPELITDELVHMRQAVYSREGFAHSVDHILALQQPEIRYRNRVTESDYAALPVPTLLVWTDHEPTGGIETGQRFAEAIPDGELLLIRNAAHWPQWEDPATFNERVVDFLQRKGN